jgi:DNA (cytosine-5)-methyltransferase 1
MTNQVGGNQGGDFVVAHAFDARQSDVIQYGDKTGPLDTDGHTMAVAHTLGIRNAKGTDERGDGSSNLQAMGSAVRRLTPRECERLQGFPDDYTLITYRGKPAADGPRYKALGNSMAVPCMRWLGERIAQVAEIT